ncbi:hypothetical protein HF521_019023, partial [Silurus meridionalis]
FGSFADTIRPLDINIVRHETETVTLKCFYDSGSEHIRLYWYKQYPNSAPPFLLFKGSRSAINQYNPTGLESTTTRDSTKLSIGGLKLSDSALYHCALKYVA